MALLTFQIAALSDAATGTTDPTREYNLDALQGTPDPATPQIQSIDRPGVDYHGIRKLGRVGAPFQMTSAEYVETLVAATEQLARYHELKGDPIGVKIIHKSDPTGPELSYYPADVLDVRFARAPYRVSNVSGSLVSNPTACLRCVWTFRLRNAEPDV